MTDDPMIEVPASRLRELRDKESRLEELTGVLRSMSHYHVWDILGIYKPPGPVHPRAIRQTTIVLLRCSGCNLPDTIDLDGQWTIDQIRARLEEEGEKTNERD